MTDPIAPPEILSGKLTKAAPEPEAPVSLDEARRRREAIEAASDAPMSGPIAAGPPAELQGASEPAETPQQALADQLVMFVSADGLRRFETVREPFLSPPPFIELACAGKQKVIAVPGEDATETRRYAFRQTVVIRGLGLMVHHFQEC